MGVVHSYAIIRADKAFADMEGYATDRLSTDGDAIHYK